jgi:hypothetical protein
VSLICISILSLSACTSIATVLTGVVGVGDSMYKSHQIDEMNKRLDRMEKIIKKREDKFKPYIPSFVDMDTYKKSFIDGKWDKDKRKK